MQIMSMLTSSMCMIVVIVIIVVVIQTGNFPELNPIKAIGVSLDNLFSGNNKVCQKIYGDSAFAHLNSCYSCPSSHPNRTIFDISGEKACEGTEATIRKNKNITEPLAYDIGAGVFFSCPENSTRNLLPVNSDTPCTGECSKLYGPKSFEHMLTGECYTCEGDSQRNLNAAGSNKECTRKCPDGFEADPDGSCFKCPEGLIRSLTSVHADDACWNFEKKDKAIFADPWLHSWKKNGNKSIPLKTNESIFSKSKLLGNIPKKENK